jgi:hypothetical protein
MTSNVTSASDDQDIHEAFILGLMRDGATRDDGKGRSFSPQKDHGVAFVRQTVSDSDPT